MYSPLTHLVPVLTHTTTIFFMSGSRVITMPAITFRLWNCVWPTINSSYFSKISLPMLSATLWFSENSERTMSVPATLSVPSATPSSTSPPTTKFMLYSWLRTLLAAAALASFLLTPVPSYSLPSTVTLKQNFLVAGE